VSRARFVAPAIAAGLAVGSIAVAAGCALTSRGEALDVRSYTPERTHVVAGATQASGAPQVQGGAQAEGATQAQGAEGALAPVAPTGAAGPALRFGRVTSGPDLGLRIAHGDGAYEVDYYDDRRWTERPELYVRRALGRALFEEGSFRRDLGGRAPQIDAEVLAFQEVQTPDTHAARIVLRVSLSTDHVLFEDTVGAVEPVLGARFDDVVAAMARALDATVAEVARRVGSALPRPAFVAP
jgi:hypothetical protein